MNVFLKVKIKSLVAESRIIRAMEKKYPGDSTVRGMLRAHRIKDVRDESRAAFLAYGYLRGRTYQQIESKPLTEPNWKRVISIVEKFGPKVAKEFDSWKPAEKAAA